MLLLQRQSLESNLTAANAKIAKLEAEVSSVRSTSDKVFNNFYLLHEFSRKTLIRLRRYLKHFSNKLRCPEPTLTPNNLSPSKCMSPLNPFDQLTLDEIANYFNYVTSLPDSTKILAQNKIAHSSESSQKVADIQPPKSKMAKVDPLAGEISKSVQSKQLGRSSSSSSSSSSAPSSSSSGDSSGSSSPLPQDRRNRHSSRRNSPNLCKVEPGYQDAISIANNRRKKDTSKSKTIPSSVPHSCEKIIERIPHVSLERESNISEHRRQKYSPHYRNEDLHCVREHMRYTGKQRPGYCEQERRGSFTEKKNMENNLHRDPRRSFNMSPRHRFQPHIFDRVHLSENRGHLQTSLKRKELKADPRIGSSSHITPEKDVSSRRNPLLINKTHKNVSNRGKYDVRSQNLPTCRDRSNSYSRPCRIKSLDTGSVLSGSEADEPRLHKNQKVSLDERISKIHCLSEKHYAEKNSLIESEHTKDMKPSDLNAELQNSFRTTSPSPHVVNATSKTVESSVDSIIPFTISKATIPTAPIEVNRGNVNSLDSSFQQHDKSTESIMNDSAEVGIEVNDVLTDHNCDRLNEKIVHRFGNPRTPDEIDGGDEEEEEYNQLNEDSGEFSANEDLLESQKYSNSDSNLMNDRNSENVKKQSDRRAKLIQKDYSPNVSQQRDNEGCHTPVCNRRDSDLEEGEALSDGEEEIEEQEELSRESSHSKGNSKSTRHSRRDFVKQYKSSVKSSTAEISFTAVDNCPRFSSSHSNKESSPQIPSCQETKGKLTDVREWSGSNRRSLKQNDSINPEHSARKIRHSSPVGFMQSHGALKSNSQDMNAHRSRVVYQSRQNPDSHHSPSRRYFFNSPERPVLTAKRVREERQSPSRLHDSFNNSISVRYARCRNVSSSEDPRSRRSPVNRFRPFPNKFNRRSPREISLAERISKRHFKNSQFASRNTRFFRR